MVRKPIEPRESSSLGRPIGLGLLPLPDPDGLAALRTAIIDSSESMLARQLVLMLINTTKLEKLAYASLRAGSLLTNKLFTQNQLTEIAYSVVILAKLPEWFWLQNGAKLELRDGIMCDTGWNVSGGISVFLGYQDKLVPKRCVPTPGIESHANIPVVSRMPTPHDLYQVQLS